MLKNSSDPHRGRIRQRKFRKDPDSEKRIESDTYLSEPGESFEERAIEIKISAPFHVSGSDESPDDSESGLAEIDLEAMERVEILKRASSRAETGIEAGDFWSRNPEDGLDRLLSAWDMLNMIHSDDGVFSKTVRRMKGEIGKKIQVYFENEIGKTAHEWSVGDILEYLKSTGEESQEFEAYRILLQIRAPDSEEMSKADIDLRKITPDIQN